MSLRQTVIARQSGFISTVRLPLPVEVWFCPGNIHDLTVFKEQNVSLPNSPLFGDKAFCDTRLKKQLKEQNTRLLVLLKKPKGGVERKQFRALRKIDSV